MRFMTIVKAAENQGPPPPALLEAIARGSQEPSRAPTLVGMGGLAPTAVSTRVRAARGALTVTDGPFTEAKEVIGGYAMLELPSREAAVEAARWFMQLHLDHWPEFEGEVEVRQLLAPGEMPDGCGPA